MKETDAVMLLSTMLLLTISSSYADFDGTTCGKTKGCFVSGDLKSSWVMKGSKIEMEIGAKVGKDPSWVALGLNPEYDMAKTYYFFCTTNGKGGVGVNDPDNSHRQTATVYGDKAANYSEMLETSSKDGTVYCKLNVSMSVPPKMPHGWPIALGSLNESAYLIIAYGSLQADGTSFNGHLNPPAQSPQLINICSPQKGSVTAAQWLTPEIIMDLKKAHGALMATAWIFCATTAVLVARYFKGSFWGREMVAGKALWFQIHQGLNFFACACTLVAFVLIFVAKEGHYEGPVIGTPAEFFNWHSILGILCSVLSFLQPIGAAFRPHPGTPRRQVFNWGHRLLGVSAWVLGAATLWQATKFPYLGKYLTDTPFAQILLIVFWSVVGVSALLFEIHYWVFVRVAPENSFDLDKGSSSTTFIALDGARSAAMLLVALLGLVVALTFVFVIAFSK